MGKLKKEKMGIIINIYIKNFEEILVNFNGINENCVETLTKFGGISKLWKRVRGIRKIS